MGKMKRKRQKAHIAAVKEKAETKPASSNTNDVTMEQKQKPASAQQKSSVSISENLFSGVHIDLAGMKKELPELDARSGITSKSLKGNSMTKVEKRKLKHDFWMKKVDAIQAAKKEEKARKKRRKTPIVGDLRGLADALPTLDLLLKDNPMERAREREKKFARRDLAEMKSLRDFLCVKKFFKGSEIINIDDTICKDRTSKKSIPRAKTRQKRMLDDIAVFNQVLAHPAFKSDPQGTMKEHLQNWAEQQQKMDQS